MRKQKRGEQETPAQPFSRVQSDVALDAVCGDKTLAEPAKLRDGHANRITDWRNQLVRARATMKMTTALGRREAWSFSSTGSPSVVA